MNEDRHTRQTIPSGGQPRPFPRSYWVSHPRLLAGCYPGNADPGQARAKITALLNTGVRLIINLMEPREIGHNGKPLEPYNTVLSEVATELGVQAHMDRFSIPDMSVPTPVHMRLILDAIDTTIADGATVYVHCWGGRGRTGTVVGCWLARHGIATGDAAISRIAELRAKVPKAHLPSPETEPQREMVRGWGEIK